MFFRPSVVPRATQAPCLHPTPRPPPFLACTAGGDNIVPLRPMAEQKKHGRIRKWATCQGVGKERVEDQRTSRPSARATKAGSRASKGQRD
eukprot:746531-Hanusia_phi.AAC.1